MTNHRYAIKAHLIITNVATIDSEMCTAAFIRFIAQVSLKAIRGEVVIYYGVLRASETSKIRLIRFLEPKARRR